MARRVAVLALAACLALGAAACGEGEEPTAGAGPEAADTATAREAVTEVRDPEAGAGRDTDPARTEGDEKAHAGQGATAEPQPAEPEPEPAEPQPEPQPRERARSDPERTLQRVKRVVRRIVSLISEGDPAVCRAFFTQRYADLVSGLEGERAFRKCERDIEQNKGSLKVTAFGPSSIRDTEAVVKFNLEAAGALTSQQWRLVFSGGRWLVDGKG